MGRLRALASSLGFEDVATYLQSGNLVFSSDRVAVDELNAVLEDAIAAEFGFESSVVIRTSEQWLDAMAADPLLQVATAPARHLVGFCAGDPAPDGRAALESEDYGEDQIRIVGRHVYLWCPAGISASPIFKLNLDRLLGTVLTTRNWSTVTRLAAMVADPG